MGTILAVMFGSSALAVTATPVPTGSLTTEAAAVTASPPQAGLRAGAAALAAAVTANALQAGPRAGEAALAADLAAARPLLAQLSPRQLAGQRVIFSYSGATPPAGLLSLIRHGQAGGVIFFKNNITSRAQITGVIKQLEAANRSVSNPARAYPLLLMTDQEGGEVRRLPGAPRPGQPPGPPP